MLFPFLLSAQNVWYVDRDANGANTGRSWEDAWNDFDSTRYASSGLGINWNIIEAGDTIYISGGTDSTTYRPASEYGIQMISVQSSLRPTFADGDPVIIIPASESGRTTGEWANHIGDVYFGSIEEAGTILWIAYVSNIRIEKINFVISHRQTTFVRIGGSTESATLDSLIILDSCYFKTEVGGAGSIGFMTSKSWVNNSIIDHVWNDYCKEYDDVGANGGEGNNGMDGNTFILRNGYEIMDNMDAGVEVTVTDTSLTDTRVNMETNYHVDNQVFVGLYYLQITSNTATTFYGTWDFDSSWAGGSQGGATITDTSLIDNFSESSSPNLFVGAIMVCDGDSLLITSSSNHQWYGSAGWYNATEDPVTNPDEGLTWRVVAGDEPADGMAWQMGGTHRDIIQLGDINYTASGSVARFTFSNNFVIDTRKEGNGWNAMFYNYGGGYGGYVDLYIYNNIFVMQKTKTDPAFITVGQYNHDYPISVFVFNNTFIAKGYGEQSAIVTSAVDTLIYKNNLFVIDTVRIDPPDGHTLFYNHDDAGHFAATYVDIDYNIYSRVGGVDSSDMFSVEGSYHTFTQWNQTLGFDANSHLMDASEILFTNKYDSTATAYYTETGNGQGVNLWGEYPFLRNDALGNARPEVGAWDIGALEFQDGAVDSIPSFSFTPVTNAELNTEYIATSPITGIDTLTHFWTTTGAEFKINYNGAYNTAMKTADPDDGADTVYVKNITGGLYDQPYTETIVGGGNSQNFNVTTKTEPPPPGESNGKLLIGNSGLRIYSKDGKLINTK